MDVYSGTKSRKKGNIILKQVVSLFAAVMIMAFATAWAVGAELKVIPSIGLMESYNDNIYLTPQYQVKGWVTTVTPGLELTGRTERLDVSLSARGKFDYYTSYDDSAYKNYYYFSGTQVGNDKSLNISQYYNGMVGYKLTPRFRMTANAGWTTDYGSDRDIQQTGLVMGNYQRDRYSTGLSGTWNITEKLTLGAGYSFAHDDYHSDGMSNLTAHQANMWLYYILGLRTKARLNAGYSHYYFSDYNHYNVVTKVVTPISERNADSYWSTVGIEYQYHELWKITADAGGQYARSTYPESVSTATPSNWGGVVKTALEYNDEKNRLVLAFNYDVAPASSSMGSGPVQRIAFIVNAQRRLIYELSALLSAGYYLNRATATNSETVVGTEVNVETYRINPALRYNVTKDIYLNLAYEFTNLHDRDLGTTAQRNLVMLQLYVQWPLTW